MSTDPGAPSLPPTPFSVPWRIRDVLISILYSTLAFIAGVLLIIIVIGTGIAIQQHRPLASHQVQELLHRLLESSPSFELLLLLQGLWMVFFMSVCLLRPHAFSWRAFFPTGSGPKDARVAMQLLLGSVVVSLGLVVVIIGVIVGVSIMMQRDPAGLVSGYLNGLEGEAQVLLTPEVGWSRLLLAIGLIPPIEEFLYRGCLYSALRKRCGVWSSIMISSLVFALSHHYVLGLPNILLIGVLGAYAYERTRSLRAPILFHMLWNTLCAAGVQPILWFLLLGGLAGLLVWTRRIPQSRVKGEG